MQLESKEAKGLPCTAHSTAGPAEMRCGAFIYVCRCVKYSKVFISEGSLEIKP